MFCEGTGYFIFCKNIEFENVNLALDNKLLSACTCQSDKENVCWTKQINKQQHELFLTDLFSEKSLLSSLLRGLSNALWRMKKCFWSEDNYSSKAVWLLWCPKFYQHTKFLLLRAADQNPARQALVSVLVWEFSCSGCGALHVPVLCSSVLSII